MESDRGNYTGTLIQRLGNFTLKANLVKNNTLILMYIPYLITCRMLLALSLLILPFLSTCSEVSTISEVSKGLETTC